MSEQNDPSTDPEGTLRLLGSSLWVRVPDDTAAYVDPWAHFDHRGEWTTGRPHGQMAGSVVVGRIPAKPVPGRVTLDFADLRDAELFAGWSSGPNGVGGPGTVHAYDPDRGSDPEPASFEVACVSVETLPGRKTPGSTVSDPAAQRPSPEVWAPDSDPAGTVRRGAGGGLYVALSPPPGEGRRRNWSRVGAFNSWALASELARHSVVLGRITESGFVPTTPEASPGDSRRVTLEFPVDRTSDFINAVRRHKEVFVKDEDAPRGDLTAGCIGYVARVVDHG